MKEIKKIKKLKIVSPHVSFVYFCCKEGTRGGKEK